MINIRLPNITATTERDQLIQVKSYLHQLVQELNWALTTVETTSNKAVTQEKQSGSAVTKDEMTTSYNELKSLIIKSAGTVSSYLETAEEKFNSLYVAQSDFGTYKEEASQEILKTSTAVQNFYDSMQEILTDIESLEHSVIAANAYIKSGLLDYDGSGVPVYGMEVGQKTSIDGVESFDAFARFTSDRLSFYDQNGSEVAYISDYKLYITHVEIKGSLREGGYVDTVTSDGGIVTKWVGLGG